MIELRHVSGGYGAPDTVKNVSLIFPDGAVSAVIGPNGCGKTTLLKLCCGLLPAKVGSVMLNGSPLRAMPRKKIAQRVSFLPQSRAVPDITVGSLVLHGRFPWLGYPRVYREQDQRIADTAMKRLGVWEKRDCLLSRLSGGERQKAYLALMLAQSSGNLLLDEPTSYLDIARQLELMETLSGLRDEGKCVVAVLHDLNMALELADRLVVMKEGTLLAIGTPKQVTESGAIQEAFQVRLTKETRYRFVLP